jgi:hypothetical protein
VRELVEARLVRQELSDRDLLFAVAPELGPVLGNRRFVVNQPVRREHVDRGRSNPLGARVANRHGVLLPGRAVVARRPGPNIDDGLAFQEHRCRCAATIMLDLLAQELGDGFESRLIRALDFDPFGHRLHAA